MEGKIAKPVSVVFSLLISDLLCRHNAVNTALGSLSSTTSFSKASLHVF